MRILNFKNFVQMNENNIIHKNIILDERVNEETKSSEERVRTIKINADVYDLTALYELVGLSELIPISKKEDSKSQTQNKSK